MTYHFCIEGFNDYSGFDYINLNSEPTIQEFEKEFSSNKEANGFAKKQLKPGVMCVAVYTKQSLENDWANTKAGFTGDVGAFYVQYKEICD